MKKFLLMACLAIFSGVVCSCSDDDDDNGGGGSTKASVSINGKDVNFSHSYYAIASDGECEIMFSNISLTSAQAPQRYSMLVISVPTRNGMMPTGTFSNTEYDVTLLVNSDPYSENYDYYLEEAYQQGGELVIGKNGDAYTITIGDLRLEGEKDSKNGEGGEWVEVGTSFNYTGALKKLDLDIE